MDKVIDSSDLSLIGLTSPSIRLLADSILVDSISTDEGVSGCESDANLDGRLGMTLPIGSG